MVASPEERDLHFPLVTAHSVLLFSLPRPISRFIRGNGGQGPTESSWSISPVSIIQDAPQFPQSSLIALSLLRSYRESLSVTRAKPIVSSRRASYLAASFATTVCASKELYLTAAAQPTSTAGLLSSPLPHQPLPLSAPKTHSRQRYTLIISTAFG